MKLMIALAFLSTIAFADEKRDRFNQAKERMISNFDQRISAMQTAKGCLQKASKHEELKACQNTFRDSMKKLQAEHKGKREAWKEERKAKREKK